MASLGCWPPSTLNLAIAALSRISACESSSMRRPPTDPAVGSTQNEAVAIPRTTTPSPTAAITPPRTLRFNTAVPSPTSHFLQSRRTLNPHPRTLAPGPVGAAGLDRPGPRPTRTRSPVPLPPHATHPCIEGPNTQAPDRPRSCATVNTRNSSHPGASPPRNRSHRMPSAGRLPGRWLTARFRRRLAHASRAGRPAVARCPGLREVVHRTVRGGPGPSTSGRPPT